MPLNFAASEAIASPDWHITNTSTSEEIAEAAAAKLAADGLNTLPLCSPMIKTAIFCFLIKL